MDSSSWLQSLTCNAERAGEVWSPGLEWESQLEKDKHAQQYFLRASPLVQLVRKSTLRRPGFSLLGWEDPWRKEWLSHSMWSQAPQRTKVIECKKQTTGVLQPEDTQSQDWMIIYWGWMKGISFSFLLIYETAGSGPPSEMELRLSPVESVFHWFRIPKSWDGRNCHSYSAVAKDFTENDYINFSRKMFHRVSLFDPWRQESLKYSELQAQWRQICRICCCWLSPSFSSGLLSWLFCM